MRNFVSSVLLLLILAGASCSRNNNNLFPVSGSVTVNGDPAAGATVFFHPQGADTANAQTVMGVVQEDGSFELVCGSLGNGAPPGEYDVSIEWKLVTGQRKGKPERGLDKLKGRYSDPRTSRLHATVEATRNELDPFELTE